MTNHEKKKKRKKSSPAGAGLRVSVRFIRLRPATVNAWNTTAEILNMKPADKKCLLFINLIDWRLNGGEGIDLFHAGSADSPDLFPKLNRSCHPQHIFKGILVHAGAFEVKVDTGANTLQRYDCVCQGMLSAQREAQTCRPEHGLLLMNSILLSHVTNPPKY